MSRRPRRFLVALLLTVGALWLGGLAVEAVVLHWVAAPLIPERAPVFLDLVNTPDARTAPRLIGLSDSFGAAGGTATNVFRLTAHALAAATSPAPRVRNLSIGGTGPHDEARLLKHFGEPISGGDVVVQMIFTGNDLSDATEPVWMAGSYPLRRGPHRWLPTSWLWPRILALAWIHRGSPAAADAPQQPSHVPPPGDPAFAAIVAAEKAALPERPPTYSTDFARFLWREGHDAWSGPETPSAHRHVAAALADVRAWTAARGVPWVLVAIPDRAALDPAVRAAVPPPAGTDPDRPRRWLRRVADELDADAFVDLQPAFAAAVTTDAALWLPQDTHWSIVGRELAAREVAAALARLGWPGKMRAQ